MTLAILRRGARQPSRNRLADSGRAVSFPAFVFSSFCRAVSLVLEAPRPEHPDAASDLRLVAGVVGGSDDHLVAAARPPWLQRGGEPDRLPEVREGRVDHSVLILDLELHVRQAGTPVGGGAV